MKKYLIAVIGVLLFAGSVGLVTKYVILDKNDNKTEQPDKGKDNTIDNDVKPDDEDKTIVISDVVVDFEKCEDKIFENKNLELSRFIENIGKNKSENSIQKCSVLKNEKGNLVLSVEDNGGGMDAERLDEISSMRFNPEDRGKKIGLSNIRGRLYYLYGNTNCMNIESEMTKGTRIIIEFGED